MTSTLNNTGELVGRRALVTGGSRGIGAAVARRLAAGGARVAVIARSMHEQAPEGALFVEGDLSTRDAAEDAVRRALATLGGLDILVNNAGAAQPFLPDSAAIPDEAWVDAMHVNFLSAVRVTQTALAALKDSPSAAIVNITAVSTSPAPGPVLHYLSAKAALNVYTLGLGRELASCGIRVNLVTPGPVITPGGDAFRQVMTDAMGIPAEAFLHNVPLGSFGRPEEVAELVAFLVSERGRWMTMHNYFVDGGMAAL